MRPSNDLLSSLIFRLNAREMRGTGEAVMKKLGIIGGRKPPGIGVVAIIGGALLGSFAAAAPAQSADLSPYYPYQYTGYGPGYNGYYGGCHSCGCYSCGYRPFIRPSPVIERHWTDYWERRYWPYGGYPYYSNGYGGYPYYPSGYDGYGAYGGYGGYPDGYAAYGSSGPRPRLGFGGIQYPPAPVSYEYQAPPGPAYGYQASARPAYDYQASARPAYDYQASAPPPYDYQAPRRSPAGVPRAFSNASYVE
jgi:hypothetical protein